MHVLGDLSFCLFAPVPAFCSGLGPLSFWLLVILRVSPLVLCGCMDSIRRSVIAGVGIWEGRIFSKDNF